MADQDNGHGKTRLDRIEGIIEALANRQVLIEDEFARLLKAQVVMFDTMNNLGEMQRQADERQRQADERQRQADDRQRQADERQRQADDRLNALIAIVDDLIRRGPLQPPRA
jgi:hypothetical protein